MGMLIKYEFRKQLSSKLIIGFILALFEVLFFIGLMLKNEEMFGMGLTFFNLTAVIALLFMGFEAIMTYSNDLKTKQSYMLFLVPRNAFQIVGAKIITMVIQLAVAGAAYAALLIMNIFLLAARYGEIEDMLEGLRDLIKAFSGIEIRIADFLWVFAMLLVRWLVFITMAMLAITLSTTLFANKKWKGVASFLIYLLLNWGVGKIAAAFTKDKFFTGSSLIVNTAAWAYILFYIVIIVLDFLGTAFLLEKKVSV